MTERLRLEEWLYPAGLVVGGYLLGWLLEIVVLRSLRRLANRTDWKLDNLLIDSLRGMPRIWLAVAGAQVARYHLPLAPPIDLTVHRILLVVLIFSVTIAVARLAVGLVQLYLERSQGQLPRTSLFSTFTRIIVVLMGVLVILQALDISIGPILGALGVGGLAVALALQDTLSNLFAGLHILATRQIKPGDYVKLAGSSEEGYVTDISWRNTTIRNITNNMVVVPNATLASSIIVNYYEPEPLISVRMPVGVAYDSDLVHVERVTIEVATEVMRDVQGGIPEFEPYIRYNEFGDSSINFMVIMRGREFRDQFLLKHEFVKRLHHRYGQEGIEIPFPIRTVYLRGMHDTGFGLEGKLQLQQSNPGNPNGNSRGTPAS